VLFINVLDFSFFLLLIHLPAFKQLFDFLVEFLLLLLFLTDFVRFSLKLILLPVNIVLNLFQLLRPVNCAQMPLPLVASTLYQILKQGAEPWELGPDEAGVNEFK
jgi:hypothetical protein